MRELSSYVEPISRPLKTRATSEEHFRAYLVANATPVVSNPVAKFLWAYGSSEYDFFSEFRIVFGLEVYSRYSVAYKHVECSNQGAFEALVGVSRSSARCAPDTRSLCCPKVQENHERTT